MPTQLGPTIEAAEELKREHSEAMIAAVNGDSSYAQRLFESQLPSRESLNDPNAAGPTFGTPQTKANEFVDSIKVGFLNATKLPQLFQGAALESVKDAKTGRQSTTGKIGESVGHVAELGAELSMLGKALVSKGMVPLGKTLFPKLFGAAVTWGAQEATSQARLKTAEVLHGTSLGYQGAAEVAKQAAIGAGFEAVALGVLVAAQKLGIGKVFSLFRGGERKAAERALGVKPGASVQELESAYQRQAEFWNPDNWRGDQMALAQVKSVYASKIEQFAAAREKLSRGALDVVARTGSEAAKPATLTDSMYDYLAVQSADTGSPMLPENKELAAVKLEATKRMAEARAKATSKSAKLEAAGVKPNRKVSPWKDHSYAMAQLESETGVPVVTVGAKMTSQTYQARKLGEKIVQEKFSTADITQLTPKDNQDIAMWLHSPQTRAAVEANMSPHAKEMAQRAYAVYHGRIAKSVQEGRFRIWEEGGAMPPDIWGPAADTVLQGVDPVTASAPRARTLVAQLLKKPRGEEKIAEKVKSFGKENQWTAEQVTAARVSLTHPDTLATMRSLKDYPKAVLEAGKAAHASGQLREWIDTQPLWGVREFYYASNPAEKDIFDEWLMKVPSAVGAGKRAVGAPGMTPSALHTRTAEEASIKPGSVIQNLFYHAQRIEVFNATRDTLKQLYGRFNEIGITQKDKAMLDSVVGNLLSKHQDVQPIFEVAAKLRGGFWQSKLSAILRPQSLAYMMLRDVSNAVAVGGFSEKSSAVAKMPWNSLVGLANKVTGGRTLEAIDPQMALNHAKFFAAEVSQKVSLYTEHLMSAATAISKDFNGKPWARRVSEILQASTQPYGQIDDMLRDGVWITKYKEVKQAAQAVVDGKISANKFMSTTNASTLTPAHRNIVADRLGNGEVDELANDMAGWAAAHILGNYKTPLRAGAEQWVESKIAAGPIVFTRTLVQQMYYRGVKPFAEGAWNGTKAIMQGNYGEGAIAIRRSADGVANLVRGIVTSTTAGQMYKAAVGIHAYNIINEANYQFMDPGASTLYSWMDYNRKQVNSYMSGQQSGGATADAIAENFCKVLELWFVPGSVEVHNMVEARRGVAGMTLYRDIRNSIAPIFGVKPKPYVKVTRSQYEATVHALLGKFEYTNRKAPAERTESVEVSEVRRKAE